MSGEDSFATRARNACRGTFDPCMRRSIQSICLYEADRCLLPRYPHLKAFQKKIALYSTALELAKSLDFLPDHNHEEIMYRTTTSKQPVPPHLAWKRLKRITREIKSLILPKMKELMEGDGKGKDHDELCELFLQREFEEFTQKAVPRPRLWEFRHYNIFTTYRIYYRGLDVDPNLFPAIPPKMVTVPDIKPANMHGIPNGNRTADANTHGAGTAFSDASLPDNLQNMHIGNQNRVVDEERRAMLKEVKDHTELLKQFEGVIPDEELAARKRALYMALPPVPPPAHFRFGHESPGGRRRMADVRAGRMEARQQRKKAKASPPIESVAKEDAEVESEVALPSETVYGDEWEKVDEEEEEEEVKDERQEKTDAMETDAKSQGVDMTAV